MKKIITRGIAVCVALSMAFTGASFAPAKVEAASLASSAKGSGTRPLCRVAVSLSIIFL